MLASGEGHVECVIALLDKADVDRADEDGTTAPLEPSVTKTVTLTNPKTFPAEFAWEHPPGDKGTSKGARNGRRGKGKQKDVNF